MSRRSQWKRIVAACAFSGGAGAIAVGCSSAPADAVVGSNVVAGRGGAGGGTCLEKAVRVGIDCSGDSFWTATCLATPGASSTTTNCLPAEDVGGPHSETNPYGESACQQDWDQMGSCFQNSPSDGCHLDDASCQPSHFGWACHDSAADQAYQFAQAAVHVGLDESGNDLDACTVTSNSSVFPVATGTTGEATVPGVLRGTWPDQECELVIPDDTVPSKATSRKVSDPSVSRLVGVQPGGYDWISILDYDPSGATLPRDAVPAGHVDRKDPNDPNASPKICRFEIGTAIVPGYTWRELDGTYHCLIAWSIPGTGDNPVNDLPPSVDYELLASYTSEAEEEYITGITEVTSYDPSATCDPTTLYNYQSAIDTACKPFTSRTCKQPPDSSYYKDPAKRAAYCEDIAKNFDDSRLCAKLRSERQKDCFRGTDTKSDPNGKPVSDPTHIGQIKQEISLQAKCFKLYEKFCAGRPKP
jgi:hypothetical protein